MGQNIPDDPVMLLSFVNTQLRDHFSTLSEFCRAYDVEEETLREKLLGIDYRYDAQRNQFQ